MEVLSLMESNNRIKDYINSVCNQIKWKNSHIYISKELENHIIDLKDSLLAQGLEEDESTERAIAEMGDPVLIGNDLDKIHRPKVEWSIVALTTITLLLGLVVQFIIASESIPSVSNSISYSLIGLAAMILAYFSDYTLIGKYPLRLYFGFLVGVLAIEIASSYMGGNPSYAKYVLLLYPTIFSGIIYSMRNRGYLGLAICGLALLVSYLILLPFNTYSTFVLYSLLALVLLSLSILKGWFNIHKIKGILLIFFPAIAGISFLLIRNPYLSFRFINAFRPEFDSMGAGYISTLTRDIISNAKFIGEGLGASTGYMVPEIYTDSLLTYLIHRFGWISFIIIAAVLALLIIKSFKLCLKQNSILSSLVSLSIVLTITAQIVIYIAYNLGFYLIAPLTLPFISYGGTGLVINMVLIGIMLSVFKWGNLVNDNVVESYSKKFIIGEIRR